MTWLKLVVRKGCTWSRLSIEEHLILLPALILLPLIALLLQALGLNKTQSLLMKLVASSVSPVTTKQEQIWLTVRMVKIATRYYRLWNNCLRESLLLWWLLYCQGIVSELRLGVQNQQEQFQAHAWVEYNGYPLNELEDVRQRFATFNQPINLLVGNKGNKLEKGS